MWVYTGIDVERRLSLTTEEGFWVDYWLFLHADETHPIWRCRPIGLTSLAKMAKGLDPLVDRRLVRAIAEELENYLWLAPYFDVPPPRAPAASCCRRGCILVPNWLKWLERFEDTAEVSRILSKLCRDLAECIKTSNYSKSTFLTRRLSSELSDSFMSPKSLFLKAKTLFLTNPAGSLEDRLTVLTTAPETIDYNVIFSVVGVPVSRQLARSQCGPSECSLIVAPSEQTNNPRAPALTLIASS